MKYVGIGIQRHWKYMFVIVLIMGSQVGHREHTAPHRVLGMGDSIAVGGEPVMGNHGTMGKIV